MEKWKNCETFFFFKKEQQNIRTFRKVQTEAVR